jgi:predicted Zn-dependent protease
LVFHLLEPITPRTEAQIKQIERMCRERLDRNPQDLDAMFTLAAVMARQGNVELAIAMVEGLLAVNPEYPGGVRLLATLHRMLGDDGKWREYMEMAGTITEV